MTAKIKAASGLGFRLLCVTDRGAVPEGVWMADTLRDISAAGIRAILLREKDLSDDEYRALVMRVRKAVEPMPVRIMIHSRTALARELGLGVHLADGADVAGARAALGAGATIGASVHSAERAREAAGGGATFVMFGPVFAPISKPASARGGGAPAGTDALAEVCVAAGVPVVAVGGITPKNAAECRRAGAAAVASVGAILSAPNPQSVVLDFMRALGTL